MRLSFYERLARLFCTILLLGCFRLTGVAHALEPPEVRLGVVLPLTSSSSDFGLETLRGITLAVDQYNEDASHPRVRLRLADDRSSPELGAQEATRLIEDEKVLAILGPANSSVVERVARDVLIAPRREVPLVVFSATATVLTEELRYPYLFRANVSDRRRVEFLLTELLGVRKVKSLVVIHEGYGDTYGEGLARDSKEVLGRRFPTFDDAKFIAHRRNISLDDARGIASDLWNEGYRSEDCAYLLLSLNHDVMTFVQAIRDVHKSSAVPLYTIEVNHGLVAQLAAQGVNVENLRSMKPFDPEAVSIGNRFVPAFKQHFGLTPSDHAAPLAYDGMQIVLNALTRLQASGADLAAVKIARRKLRDLITNHTLPSSEFLIPGDHTFRNQELAEIRFIDFKFIGDGSTVRWDAPIPELSVARPAAAGAARAPLPNGYLVAAVLGFSFVGGWMREVRAIAQSRKSQTINWGKDLVRAIGPRPVLIDPVIALIVASSMYLSVLFANPAALDKVLDSGLASLSLGFLIGVCSGYLGWQALESVIQRFGALAGPVKQEATK